MRLVARARAFPTGILVGIGGIAAAGLVAVLGLDRLGITLCAFKRLTGIPCATCGSTRALAQLAHLDLAGALALNPLSALLTLAAFAWGAADLLLVWRGRALSLELSSSEGRGLSIAALLAVGLNWAYVLAAGR
jgi:hypothetical protein